MNQPWNWHASVRMVCFLSCFRDGAPIQILFPIHEGYCLPTRKDFKALEYKIKKTKKPHSICNFHQFPVKDKSLYIIIMFRSIYFNFHILVLVHESIEMGNFNYNILNYNNCNLAIIHDGYMFGSFFPSVSMSFVHTFSVERV